jgi:hypothetical protein
MDWDGKQSSRSPVPVDEEEVPRREVGLTGWQPTGKIGRSADASRASHGPNLFPPGVKAHPHKTSG